MNQEKVYHVVKSADRNDANLLADFSFPWLDKPAPRTEFRAWYDDTNFHFEFDVDDEDLVICQSDDEYEKVLNSDRVELFFSPTPDLSKPYYGFEIDPRGLIYDYVGVYHRQFDPSWNLSSVTTIGTDTPSGYKMEGTIPLDDLRQLGCLQGNQMITGVYRAEFSHNEDDTIKHDWIAWVDPGTKIPDFHVPESFGLFIFED